MDFFAFLIGGAVMMLICRTPAVILNVLLTLWMIASIALLFAGFFYGTTLP